MTPRAVLAWPAIATLVLSLLFWQDMRGTDDLGYAQRAMSIVHGSGALVQDTSHPHHDARLGMTYPLAAIFSVLGVSDFSLALLPLVCSVVTASLVAWLAYAHFGAGAGLMAGMLYAVFPVTIDLATLYVPEPMLQCVICLSAALFVEAMRHEAKHPAALRFVAGALIGIAWLISEAGALMLPALYSYLLVTRRIRSRDVLLAAGFAAVLLAELAYHAAVHGDALHRFAAASAYLSDPMVLAANRDLSDRLLTAIPRMFLGANPLFGVFGPLLTLAGLYGLVRWRECLLFAIWAAAILIFYNFMTVDLRHYVVLPVTARLLAPACVPLLVVAAKMTVDAWEWSSARSTAFGRHASHALLAVFAFVVIGASLLFMELNRIPDVTGAIAQNAREAARFLAQYASVTLVTDRRTARAITFYRQFSPRDSIVGFEAASRSGRVQDEPDKPAFVVLNGPAIHEGSAEPGISGRFLRADRDFVAAFSPRRGADVFSAHLRRNALAETLLTHSLTRGPLERLGYSNRLLDADRSLTGIQIFRVSDRSEKPA